MSTSLAQQSRNTERSIPAQRALDLFDQVVADMKLRSELRTWGRTGLQTTHCVLRDRRGRIVSQGSGKGLGLQSRASAQFEALEHLFTRLDALDPESILLRSCAEIEAAGDRAVLDAIPPAAHCDSEVRSRRTHWLRFRSLLEPASRDACVPAFAVDPGYLRAPLPGGNFPFERVHVSGTNSGTAAGCSVEEALLHALNEQIERHALGAALHEAFIRRSGRSALLVDRQSLPAYHQEILAEIEATFHEEVLVFEMPESFGVPAFLAVTTRRQTPAQLKGSGASASKAYALERALLELLQVLHFATQPEFETFSETEARKLENVRRWPDLLRSVQKDFAAGMSTGAIEIQGRHFAEIPELAPVSVRAQLDDVIGAFGGAGYDVLVTTLFHCAQTGISCVRSYIPELDNTWMLADGNRIRPNRRCLVRLSGAPRR